MSKTITINGDTLPYAPQPLAEYLAVRKITAQTGGIAVAINDRVIPRTAWATTTPTPNDRIEIITAIGGG
jgi:sulfur carrier protein